MIQISCSINKVLTPLKYLKINTVNGALYQGILLAKTYIGFSFRRTKDRKIVFENENITQNVKDAIVIAIKENEKTNF